MLANVGGQATAFPRENQIVDARKGDIQAN